VDHHDAFNTISVQFDKGGMIVPIQTTSINPDKYCINECVISLYMSFIREYFLLRTNDSNVCLRLSGGSNDFTTKSFRSFGRLVGCKTVSLPWAEKLSSLGL